MLETEHDHPQDTDTDWSKKLEQLHGASAPTFFSSPQNLKNPQSSDGAQSPTKPTIISPSTPSNPVTISTQPSTTRLGHTKWRRLLVVPLLCTLVLVSLSVVCSLFSLPFIPVDTLAVLYALLGLLSMVSIAISSLRYIHELDERFSDNTSTRKINVTPIWITLWPLIIISGIFLVAFTSENPAAIMGPVYVLFLTGPLSVLCSLILWGLLLAYKKGVNIQYPWPLSSAIEVAWDKFH